MTGKADAEAAFGPIEMRGPGVDAWTAFLEMNDSENANLLQKQWAKRESVRSAFLDDQKELFQQLATRDKKG